MFVKEVEMKNNKKYLIGISETENYIYGYVLEKKFIRYKKLYCHESLKTLIPDYDYVTLCTICGYEEKLKDNKRLMEWSLS
jgi:hypothetical protein